MSKFVSRKFIATAVAALAVVACDLMGLPLDPPTLDALTNMVLGLCGAQGLVDTAAAWKAGSAVSDAVSSVVEMKDDTEEAAQ